MQVIICKTIWPSYFSGLRIWDQHPLAVACLVHKQLAKFITMTCSLMHVKYITEVWLHFLLTFNHGVTLTLPEEFEWLHVVKRDSSLLCASTLFCLARSEFPHTLVFLILKSYPSSMHSWLSHLVKENLSSARCRHSRWWDWEAFSIVLSTRNCEAH